MNAPTKPIHITQTDIDELKKSSQHAQDFLKKRRIKSWPRVVTPEPGKHFLVNH